MLLSLDGDSCKYVHVFSKVVLDDVTKAQCWALRLKNPQVYMYMIFKLPVHKLFIVNMYVMLAVFQRIYSTSFLFIS